MHRASLPKPSDACLESSFESPRDDSYVNRTSRYAGSMIDLMEPVGVTTTLSARGKKDQTLDDKRFSWNQGFISPSAKSVPLRSWKSDVRENMPWMFSLALIGTVAWFGGCIGVIFAADATKTDSWAISPTVILAILGPLGSITLQYALSIGLVITWWRSALTGTTLGNLHRQWDHGTSVWAASTSWRHMDKIAPAKVTVLSVFAVNPLLQRALTTSLSTERSDVRLSTTAATDVKSLQDMKFPDAYLNGFYDAVQLSPGLSRVIQQFTEREPIIGGISGCTGNCSGTLTAAGIDARCTTIRNNSYVANYGQGAGGATLVFKTGTNIMNYRTKGDFNLTVFYAEINTDNDDLAKFDTMKSCRGVSTTVNCVLQHAVVAYPFSQIDGIITPETQGSRVRILSTEPALTSGLIPPEREPVFGGLSIAADSLFNSSGNVQTAGKYGWEYRTSGPLTATYLVRGSNATTCAVIYSDPTANIITKLNEIMFRTALAAPNATSPITEFTAQQQTVSIIYESRYAYLWGAMVVTFLAIVTVIRTASGFHNLGRPLSLSPIEIATAFGSELLNKPDTSNMAIKDLMCVYQDIKVHYTSNEVRGEEDIESGSHRRLQLTLLGNGRKPKARELFAA